MDFVYAFNAFETVLWTVLACMAAFYATRLRERRGHLVVAAVTLVLFAGSELMEMKTGAWWHPLWLMFWKGACITILVCLGIGHFRWRQAMRDNESADKPACAVADESAHDTRLP